VVKSAYARYQSGELSEEAAKTLVKDQIRAIKYGNNDYYLAYDYDGNQILHGSLPEREGKNFFTVTDPNGKQWVKEQIDRAKDGTGTVYYMAPRLGSDVRVPKLSYMIAFEPWHWVIGTGVYVDDVNARFAEVAWQFFAIAIALGLVMATSGYLLSRQITRPLARMTAALRGLAAGDRSLQVPETARRDEIGEMAQAAQVFKNNMIKYSNLPWDVILAAELAQTFRPDPKVYQVATRYLGLKPNEILMVACHKYDLRGAKAQGFRTAFVARPLEFGPNGRVDIQFEPEFDLNVASFVELADKLGV
jgi:methyl-accepting chemotaxis protein